MNIQLLLLIKKRTDTLFEQTETSAQETPELKMNKQMQTFSFNPRINLSQEGKWFLAVTSFEATNSVFNKAEANNCFSISIPGHWNSEDGEELINKLIKILELRSENDINLHVREVEKKGCSNRNRKHWL